MDIFFNHYHAAITALGALAVLTLIQLLIADVLGIMRKHEPGTTVEADHNNLLFRVSRTVGNTNESIAIFICAFAYTTLSYADPVLTAYSAWAFVFARLLYAVCYYADWRTLRSISFGLSILAIVVLLAVGLTTGQAS